MNKLQTTIDRLQAILAPAPRVNKEITFLSYGGHRYLENVPRVECEDGFAVSIQASHTHYCTPRDSTGPWSEVELGFPSRRTPSLREYRDGPPPDQGNVFGYVPIEAVAKLLIRHGGI